MTLEKTINIYRLSRLSMDQLRGKLRDAYDESTTPEVRMKRQALELVLREQKANT